MISDNIGTDFLANINFSSDTAPQEIIACFLAGETEAAGWLWNLTDGDFHLTPTFYALFGMQPAHASARANITQLLQPLLSTDDFFTLREQILQLRNGQKKRTEAEWQAEVRDKRKRFTSLMVSVKSQTDVTYLVGIIRKKSETPVANDKINAIAGEVMERSDMSVLIINTDLRIVHCNQFAADSLAYLPPEIINKIKISKIDIENTVSDWKKYCEKTRRKEPVITVTSFQRKNSTVFPVEISVTHHSYDEQEYFCLVARDVTASRLHESQIRPAMAAQEMLTKKLREERKYLKEENSRSFSLDKIITANQKYRSILTLIKQVAPTDSTVLIQGETGTGKELLAQAVHNLSRRNDRTLIKVNCANLPKDLIESELFGHEKGSFTGADKQKIGRFELAHKGSIFLDEIGEMPLFLQTRLLRVLQEGQFERVGGTETIEVNVRVIAATNRDLLKMCEEGTFRSDLYYRLHVFPITNMPLRERREDIEPLAYHFLDKFCKKSGRNITSIPKEDLKRLQLYDYPGNIRELENIIERSVILTTGRSLNLDFWMPKGNKNKGKQYEGFPTLDQVQIDHIISALEKTKWRVSGEDGAASLLGLKDQTLFSRMRKYGIVRK